MKTLQLTLQQQQALEKAISYLVDNEADHFIEELPEYLDNDVDCSEEIEQDALENPEKYDEDQDHIYTSAKILQKMWP